MRRCALVAKQERSELTLWGECELYKVERDVLEEERRHIEE